MENDTIVAVSTPIGVGAISIVRMSGKNSLSIACKIFKGNNFDYKKIESRKLYLGNFEYEEIKDECLLVYFKAPNSYTGEDIVEFQIHGSVILVQNVLDACLKNGARLATEGEFTKLAFLNGKISLDKAEGVIDTINSQSESELKAASGLVHGKLFSIVKESQKELTNLLARLEVSLDYPEHDIEYIEKNNAIEVIKEQTTKLTLILNNSDKNQFIKNGINVSIVGNVNVGKSSLLNSLVGKNRAIVTNVEGTTRDIVCETINYKGLKINFVDTAGIRESHDEIEKIGIEKSYEQIKQADIIMFVYDGSKVFNREEKEIISSIQNKPHILICNKSDLSLVKNDIIPDVVVSALKDKNINNIKELILEKAQTNNIDFSEICLTNARHIEALRNALSYMERAINCCKTETVDIVCLEIKKAWNELGKITGETENESIIDAIFSKFCLGK